MWKTCLLCHDYEADCTGRLRLKLVKRTGKPGNPSKGALQTTGPLSNRRYYVIRLKKRFQVSRLVCSAFHGLPPTGKPNCMHKDDDQQNNRPGNLKWGTQKENLNTPKFLAYCRGRTGEENPHVKGLANG